MYKKRYYIFTTILDSLDELVDELVDEPIDELLYGTSISFLLLL